MTLLSFFIIIYFLFGFGYSLGEIYSYAKENSGKSISSLLFLFIVIIITWPFWFGLHISEGK